MHTNTDYDLIIAGGGLAGLALALLVQPAGRRVLLVDGQLPISDTVAGFDDRSLALSPSTAAILADAGVWEAVAAEAAAITDIHVSDRGRFGRCLLSAAALQRPALGHVAELRSLGRILIGAVRERRAAELAVPARVIGHEPLEGACRVQISGPEGERTLTARLLIGADGGQSSLRAQAGIPVQTDDYAQAAVVANLRFAGAPAGWAYERFTRSGPLALLPLPRGRQALVWTLAPAEAARVQALDAAAFAAELQQAFGWRCGALVQVGTRSVFPLARQLALWRRQGRLLLVGNAAQQLHPVAGQGFNLALRDLAALALLLRADAAPSLAALEQFLAVRASDARHVATITHGLVSLFSNDYPLLAPLRALALSLTDALPPLKRQLAGAAMGWRETAPPTTLNDAAQ